MPAQHDLAAETELWDTFAGSAFKEGEEPEFRWTAYKGHGPGIELLGEPRRVLELGSGPGRNLAYLAQRGIQAHGLDLSPVMVAKATELWGETGAVFQQGDALTHLAANETVYDAVYSIFGPAWFADPSKLFPLVRARLREGGVFAFSQPPAIPGAYGPQGMYKNGFAGRAMFTYRYSYRPRVWERLLTRAGFATARAEVLDAPEPGHVGTLIVTAHA